MMKCMIEVNRDSTVESMCLHICRDKSETKCSKIGSRSILIIQSKIPIIDLNPEDYSTFMKSKKKFLNITIKISNLSLIIKKIIHPSLHKLDC